MRGIKDSLRTYLPSIFQAVQWLRLCTSIAGGTGDPWLGNQHVAWCRQSKRTYPAKTVLLPQYMV